LGSGHRTPIHLAFPVNRDIFQIDGGKPIASIANEGNEVLAWGIRGIYRMAKKKYYAVAVGRRPGIYGNWFGADGAEAQVKGFPNAVFKGFPFRKEAENFLKATGKSQPKIQSTSESSKTDPNRSESVHRVSPRDSSVTIYTDGGCIGNPGPGGYGVVLIKGKKRKELSGGFRRTTNNRMELMACIVGLSQLKSPAKLTLHSDSRYVVNGITKGWAKRWRSNNWMRTKEDPALNPDLWSRLLELCEAHDVKFVWVKGHAGHPENERADVLANRGVTDPAGNV